jgi:hypothetical protein
VNTEGVEHIELFGEVSGLQALYDPKTGTYFVPAFGQADLLGRVPDATYWQELLRTAPQHSVGPRATSAILDTGMLTQHPLLRPRIVESLDLTGEGFEDRHGHGTKVALRQTFVAPEVDMLNVKVKGFPAPSYEEEVERIAKGIRWAVERGTSVINLSLGVTRACKQVDEPMCAAIREAIDNGVFVVVAGEARCPAQCHPDVWVVGEHVSATQRTNTVAPPDLVAERIRQPVLTLPFEEWLRRIGAQ